MRLLSSEKGFYLTLEDREKEENDTFHELNKIPSLLWRGISAPSPAPATARGCSCTLTMSRSGALRRRGAPAAAPTPQSNSSLRCSQTVAKAAVANLRQPRPFRPLMIDSQVTQWPGAKALKPTPFLLSTNSVTLNLSSSVKRPFQLVS